MPMTQYPVSGDVAGPASSTDNALPRFDGTGGKTLQASGVIVDDNNALSGYRATLSTTTTSGTLTLDLSAPHQRITLDAARTINAPSSPGTVGAEILLLVNCAGFAITWGTGWAHKGGTPPTLTVTSGVVNVFSVVWAPSLSKWLLIYGGSYS